MPLISVLYFDDIFLAGSEPLMIECKRELASEFGMRDLGLMHYFLGLRCGKGLVIFFFHRENTL